MSDEKSLDQQVNIDCSEHETDVMILARTLGTDFDADLFIGRLKSYLSRRYINLSEAEREDIIADALYAMLKSLSEGKQIKNREGWAKRVVVNLAYDVSRRDGKMFVQSMDTLPERDLADGDHDPLAGLIKKETLASLYRALSTLPPLDHLFLMKHYLQEKKIGEIASEYGYTASAVKMRLLRARERLRKILGEQM